MGRKRLRQFYGCLGFWGSCCWKTHAHKILCFLGGEAVFFFGGGGERKCQLYLYGRRDFSKGKLPKQNRNFRSRRTPQSLGKKGTTFQKSRNEFLGDKKEQGIPTKIKEKEIKFRASPNNSLQIFPRKIFWPSPTRGVPDFKSVVSLI